MFVPFSNRNSILLPMSTASFLSFFFVFLSFFLHFCNGSIARSYLLHRDTSHCRHLTTKCKATQRGRTFKFLLPVLIALRFFPLPLSFFLFCFHKQFDKFFAISSCTLYIYVYIYSMYNHLTYFDGTAIAATVCIINRRRGFSFALFVQ